MTNETKNIQRVGNWYLATIVAGLDGHATFAEGRHCYVRRCGTRAQVIGAKGVMASLPLSEAGHRLSISRYADGRPVAVRDQAWQSHRWDKRHMPKQASGRGVALENPCGAFR